MMTHNNILSTFYISSSNNVDHGDLRPQQCEKFSNQKCMPVRETVNRADTPTQSGIIQYNRLVRNRA